MCVPTLPRGGLAASRASLTCADEVRACWRRMSTLLRAVPSGFAVPCMSCAGTEMGLVAGLLLFLRRSVGHTLPFLPAALGGGELHAEMQIPGS